MSEWTDSALGALVTINPEKTPSWNPEQTIRYVDIASVSAERGISLDLVKSLPFGEAPGRARRRVRAGDVLVSTVRPNLRAFAVVPESLDGEVASTGFAVLRADEGVLTPGFLWCLVSADVFAEAMVIRCTGSNYPAIRADDVAGHRVMLPPLEEQRRIVEVMSATDSHADSLRAELSALIKARSQILAAEFTRVTGEARPIVDLCSLVVGGIWGSPEGESETDVLALGPRIYAPGTVDFVTDGSPMRSFNAKQVEKRLVRRDDIILERSGGSPEQPVGRVVIAGDDLDPCVPTDFQRLLRADPELVNPRYLYWHLRCDWEQGITTQFSRRTTGITNLSVKDYLARQVAIPSLSDQQNVVDTADSLDAAAVALREELSRLRRMRTDLLSALLARSLCIPESFDLLLETAS